MSGPPPGGPVISPDGKYYWSDGKWVPRFPPGPPPGGATNTTALLVVGFIVLVFVGVAVWYFGYYDTAAAKCNRGDLGACVVTAAQQEAAQASASASAAAVEASASASAAAVEAQAQASARASAAAAQKCVVGPGDQSHDVRLVVSGGNTASADCSVLTAHGWANDYLPNNDSQVCSFTLSNGTTVVVWDSGGQYYGQQDCHILAQNLLPSWNGS